jgi:hypothetical protein
MKNNKKLIFIDDSGDLGFKSDSSRFLVMTAVVFENATEAEKAVAIINAFHDELNWGSKHEFKYNKTKKDIIALLVQRLTSVDFKVTSAYLDKSKHTNASTNNIYENIIVELIDHINYNFGIIYIDGRGNKEYARKATTYIRQNINRRISDDITIKFVDSKKVKLIQLSDICASATNKIIQGFNKNTEVVYKLIEPKVKELFEWKL